MSYVDLGHYPFTTRGDLTGLNAGNITSILDTQKYLNVPVFECYRIVINVSLLVVSTPTIVQSAVANAASLTALAVTLPAPTTVGNTIVAYSRWDSVGTNPTLSTVKIGAAADNFAAVAACQNVGTSGNDYVWVNPGSTVASNTVNYVAAGGSGSSALAEGAVYEVSGCLATTSAASAVDFASSNATSSGTSVTTGSGVTTKANDMMIGFGSSFNVIGPAIITTGTTAPPLTLGPASQFSSGAYFAQGSAWGLTGPIATPISYNAMTNKSGDVYAGMLALLPSAAASTPASIPFQVRIDGRTWDQQSTVAGVGYTYDMQQPLVLRDGNVMQILWTTLPTSQYLVSTPQFDIQAWFRYDSALRS